MVLNSTIPSKGLLKNDKNSEEARKKKTTEKSHLEKREKKARTCSSWLFSLESRMYPAFLEHKRKVNVLTALSRVGRRFYIFLVPFSPPRRNYKRPVTFAFKLYLWQFLSATSTLHPACQTRKLAELQIEPAPSPCTGDKSGMDSTKRKKTRRQEGKDGRIV